MQTRVIRSRWLDQRLERHTLERLLARLDVIFGAQGQRMIHDDSASWFAHHVQVTIEPCDGGTLVQMSERFVNTANTMASLGICLGAVTGMIVSMILLPVLGLAFLGTWAALPLAASFGWLGLRFVGRRHAALIEHTEEQFQSALNSIERIADSEMAP